MSVDAYKGLEASGLTKTYDDDAALDNLELIVRPGELVALVGSNGAGKSTFLRLAAGLLEPTDGDVWIDGYDAGTIDARAALSFVGDQPSLYGDLSVREHIEYVANAHEIDAWPAIADGLLESLNLDERVDDLPVRFSRGLRQKTALVLALVRPFSVLVIDEPFVGLDPAGQDALTEILVETARGGATVVIATHQLAFLERTTRCVVLNNGTLLHDGEPDLDTIGRFLE